MSFHLCHWQSDLKLGPITSSVHLSKLSKLKLRGEFSDVPKGHSWNAVCPGTKRKFRALSTMLPCKGNIARGKGPFPRDHQNPNCHLGGLPFGPLALWLWKARRVGIKWVRGSSCHQGEMTPCDQLSAITQSKHTECFTDRNTEPPCSEFSQTFSKLYFFF